MSGYMTLFVADLIQDSGLLIGGVDSEDSHIDDIFCRDGANRLTMRGRGTKGALVATARKLFGSVPGFISEVEAQYARNGSGGSSAARTHLKQSLWTVHTAHPGGASVRLEYRESVGLRQATKARAGGVLRDLEATSRGTAWPLLLEVRTDGPDGEAAERIAAATLLEWARDRLWLGKDVARGLGWLGVQNLRALRLPKDRALDWPDARVADTLSAAHALAPAASWIKPGEFERIFSLGPAQSAVESQWRYVEIRARLRAGPRDDCYGVEALSVGGVSPTSLTDGRSGHWMAPRSARKGAMIAARSSSAPYSETVSGTGKAISQPVIGGGSLRGPARHALSRAARNAGKGIRDPNVELRNPQDPFDSIEASFGTLDKSAALLFRDAHATEPDQIAWAVVQHHAEDQFSAGVFTDAKFDRAAIFNGDFDLRIVLETRDDAIENYFFEVQLPELIRLGKGGFLEIGAGKTRGYGGAPWHDVHIRRARAGKAWEDVEEIRS